MRRNQQDDFSVPHHGVPPVGANRALLACSIWLYLGFIGAAAFGGGLILLADAQADAAVALALVIFGASLAPASWLVGWRIGRASVGEASAARSPITDDCAELAAWPGVAALRDSRRR